MAKIAVVKLLDSMQTTIITGGLTPKGAYNAGTDYMVGDSVDYQGSSYVMYVDASAGTLPTNTAYWQVLADKGDQGLEGDTGVAGDTGAASTIPGDTGVSGAFNLEGGDADSNYGATSPVDGGGA